MIIDKRPALLRLKKRSLLLTLLTIAAIITVLMFDIEFLAIKANKYYYAMAMALLFVVIYALIRIKNPHYIYFSDEGLKLIFRYFSIFTFKRKNQAIEISKNSLDDFNISSKSLSRYLTLSQKTKQGVAKYPPINISFLTQKERDGVELSLKKCLSNKK